MKKMILSLGLILVGASTYAGGYRVSLQGVRQAALGAQGVAMHHDASVAFFNPAALAFVDKKVSIAFGGFGINIKSKYQNRDTRSVAETNNPIGTPFYFSASYKPTENLALGVNVTTPFGSTIDWGDKWAGRYIVNRMQLKSFFIQPTVAYRFNDWFSLGGGLVIARGAVNVKRQVQVGNTDALLEIDSKEGKGMGMNLGVFLKPNDKLNIGLAYRSQIKMTVEKGDVKFNDVPKIAAGKLPFTATYFDSELPLPAELYFGVNYNITPKLMLGAEVATVRWSAYRDLDIQLYNQNEKYNSSPSIKEYKNTVNYSFGAEYSVNPSFALRLGYKYDQSPSPGNFFNPETPTVNYHAFTGGLGYAFKNFTIDAMAEYLYGEERSFLNEQYNFGGDIFSRGFLFGVGVSYNVGTFNNQ